MLIQEKAKRNKKGQLIVIGSILMIFGIVLLSYSYLQEKKILAFETMNLQLSDINKKEETEVNDAPIVENLPEQEENVPTEEVPEEQQPISIPYIGTLEIPQINLKRGFVDKNSSYNNINYAITILPSSTYPDVDKGNFILIAHSGTAAVSFFRYLYKLSVGDVAFVEYNNIRYQYRIVNIYYEAKDGTIAIRRNYDKTTMTLITCTYQDDTRQTVYILELESQIPLS